MNLRPALKLFTDNVVRDIRRNMFELGLNPTGRTGRSLDASRSTHDKSDIIGAHWFKQLEQGRGPSKNPHVSGPYLWEAMRDYLISKGVAEPDATGIGHFIAKRMHKEGWLQDTNTKYRAARMVRGAIDAHLPELRRAIGAEVSRNIRSIFEPLRNATA